jgi:hypothetical protein
MQTSGRPSGPLLPEYSTHEDDAYPLSHLIREVFGNPFRPIAVTHALLPRNGKSIALLARSIYEKRTFERLPILAGALEDAGCTDAELLGHLRGPGPHVRGCWALDLLLAKP